MKTRFIYLLLVIFFFSGFSVAQSPRQRRDRARNAEDSRNAEAEKDKEARDELAAQLLTRAAAISSQLSDSDRAYLLSRLAQASARKQPQQSLAWADEVFTVTAGLPASMQRSQSEATAVQAAAEVDPQHALQLLGREEAQSASLPDQRPMQAVQVFQRYWQKNGIDGLDALLA